MNGISHKQAIRLVHCRLDGILQGEQGSVLDDHLQACDSCRSYSNEMDLLPARLRHEFHGRWDQQAHPQENLAATIHAKSRKLIMTKRIEFAFNILGGVIALFALVVVLNSLISQFRKPSTISNGSSTENPSPASTRQRLLAFASDKNGNLDIYTIYPDGNGLTNLTNNPAMEHNPYWSPDGKRIAFLSNRNDPGGLLQVYVMNADGSAVTQLTSNEANHEFNVGAGGPWSPDGTKLLFTEWEPGNEKWMLYTMDIDGQNKTPLTGVSNIYSFSSWSPDGQHVAFLALRPQNDPPVGDWRWMDIGIDVVDVTGDNRTYITLSLPAEESLNGAYSNSFRWTRDGKSIFFITSNFDYLTQNGSGVDPNTFFWKAYEASLDGTLTLLTSTRSPIGGWWDDVYFITPIMGSGGWTWVYPDGTVHSINPTKYCEQERLYDPGTKSYTTAVANFSQSPHGNGMIIASCPGAEVALSWVNAMGTEVKPVAKLSTAPMVGYFGSTQWSPDDRYVAFYLTGPDKTEMYIVNIADSIRDPSLPPIRVDIGKYETSLSWQPLP